MKYYFTIICAITFNTIVIAQNNAIFKGGFGDGSNTINYLQPYTDFRQGGTGDGFYIINYTQNYVDVRKGAIGDGYNANNYSQNYVDVRKGAIGDGYNTNNYVQTYADVRTGGIGDGWAVQTVILTLSPLNIDGLSFSGYQKNNSHVLNWITENEKNTDYFLLEHSIDDIHYTTLTTVKAKGNTNSKSEYEYINIYPKIGFNFYRLKQINTDGKTTMSNAVLLQYNNEKINYSVYPNPTANILNIEIQSNKKNASTSIIVMDANGKINYSSKLDTPQNKLSLDISNWTIGMYLVRLKDGDQESIFKIIKQ
jgi:hypothetical protein